MTAPLSYKLLGERRIFEGYLHRFESFTCDSLLRARIQFSGHPYELTILSISL